MDDEPKLASLVERVAKREGWSVDIAANGIDAIWQATEFDYDVIALDVEMPAPDGFAVCRTLRHEECWTPILFLTARDDVNDRVEGLDSGGDDYLAKPFAIEELAARLRALGRRSLGKRPSQLVLDDLVVDVASRTVTRADQPVNLSAKEFAILEILLRRVGEVVSRSDLIEHAWNMDYDGTSNVVDVYVGYLRRKIDHPFERTTIETVRGVGYRMSSDLDPFD